MSDSDSSGTLSSAGGDDSNDDEFNENKNVGNQQRDSILGGKIQSNRRLSTTSSSFGYGYGTDNILNMNDNKSDDDSSDTTNNNIGELDAEQMLEQEHEKLQFFNESLLQCNKLASKMNGVLQNLQDKLKKLQTTLDPIRKDTTEVATAEKNINKTMNELRRVMEYHKLTTEPLIEVKKRTLKASSGLNDNKNENDNEFNDDEWNDPFLIWIEKINEAKNYFEKNRFKSSESAIHNLGKIAEIALNRMESYFRDLLKQHTTRNKRVIDEIINYKLMNDWKNRNPLYPIWTNKLMIDKYTQRQRDENMDKENIVTDLLYIPYRVIKLLANVALRIEQTANVHNLKDKLGELVISPRSNLLLDILNSLSNENLLTIMYIYSYHKNAMKNKKNKLFNEHKHNDHARNSVSIEEKEEKEEKDENEDEKKEDADADADALQTLSAQALDKLNTFNAIDNNEDIVSDIVLIDIKSESHPIILYLHIALSLFQLERHLCSTILDVKNEILLEFDEFFNEVIFDPLQLIVSKVEQVLKIKDIMDVTRNAQINKSSDRRRVSFNQINSFIGNPNIPIEEAARITAKSTAKAAIQNDSIHKNMIIVKLDLVNCWMKLYPAFDKILNQSKDYGADINDNNSNDGNNINEKRRGMIYLSRLGDTLYLNCYDTLQNRIEKIRNHSENKNIRIDGGYHPLTIETVKLMFGIYEYRDALQHLYDTQKSISPMMNILINDKDRDDKKSNIMEKRQIEKTLVEIIKALRSNIKSKSVQYGNNKKTLEAIFMLNNLHYIVKTISDTELEMSMGQNTMTGLRNDITKYKTRYEQATWEKVQDHINISKVKFTEKSNNLSSKEKKPIKQKYAGFNKEFEEQLNTQSMYSVPDANLRLELINRNIDIVLPMYRIFVGKFKNIEFTKDRGKYHKYDEKTLHDKMHQFFQQN